MDTLQATALDLSNNLDQSVDTVKSFDPNNGEMKEIERRLKVIENTLGLGPGTLGESLGIPSLTPAVTNGDEEKLPTITEPKPGEPFDKGLHVLSRTFDTRKTL